MADYKTPFLKNIFDFLPNNNRFNNNMKEELEKRDSELLIKNKLLEEFGITLTEPSLIATDARELSDIMNEMKKRVDLKNLQPLYLRNQFIFRAINVRASEMISRGYDIVGEDQDGVDKCSKLIKESGGSAFLRQSSINSDVFGNCYWEHIYNKGGKEILLLKQIHPLTFGFTYDRLKNIIILNDDKTPKSYTQKIVDPMTGVETFIEVPKEKITHIKYNTFGDEFSGISTLQPLYDTTLRLMNMEKSAATSALKIANPIAVLKTNAKSPVILAKWMKVIGKITGQQSVSLGEEQDLKFLSPEQQLFSEYAEYFLDAVVAGTSVPRAILLGQGGGGRAETITLSKHFYRIIRDNQLIFERDINVIFEKYGKLANFKAPKFIFKDVAEDADALGEMAKGLFESGIIDREEARLMIGINGPGGKKLIIDGASEEIKKNDMKTFFPKEVKSPEGSQITNKSTMKKSPDSSTPSIK